MAKHGYPDPFLTANLYCKGFLDELVHQVVRPFWLESAPQREGTEPYLWMLRYGRGGEHLKIRVHGPESLRPTLRDSLAEKAALFFGQLQAPAAGSPEPGQSAAPPIDPEDQEAEHADRTLLWTTYRRSPIVLGAPPLPEDARYAGLFTRCLGHGCEVVLARYASGPPLAAGRQAALLELLASGVAALWPTQAERVSYFSYHRDWLVRIPILKRQLGTRKAREVLERYDKAAQGFDPARKAALKALLQPEGGPPSPWARSLTDLREDLRRFEGKPEYSVDPLVAGPLYPAVFKVLHGLANQLGVNPLNEGLAHHLALHTLAPQREESFSLIPE